MDHQDAQGRVMRYLPLALCVVVAFLAVTFGMQDHTWGAPVIIIVFSAVILWITKGRMGP